MAFSKVDTSFVVDEDPSDILKELDEERLPKWFWTREEWVKYTVYRMKILSLVETQKKSEELSLIEE